MKKLLVTLVLISSIQVFATPQSCDTLAGTYSCEFQGDSYPLDIKFKNDELKSTVVVDIAGDGGEYIVDGERHDSTNDDSEYVAQCENNNEVIIKNYFLGEFKGSVSILETENGVEYKLSKGSQGMTFPCTRK